MRGVVQRVWVACSVLVLAVSLASPASAAIVLVRSLGDGPANTANCPGASCRLRDAIAAAASGDTIDFDSGLSGTVSLQFAQGELVIDKDLRIWGPGADQNAIVIAAAGSNRVFTVASGVSLSLHFLFVRSGNLSTSGDGGNIFNQGTLTLDRVTVDSGTARNGGCLYSVGPSLTIRNSLFQSCFANGGGAAIYATGSQRVLIDRTSFFSNTAVSGNGGAVALASVAQAHILNSAFYSNNSNQASGGALSIDGGTVFLVNSSFGQSTASSAGGGHVASAGATLYVVNSTLVDGSTSGAGGGFFVSGGSASLYNTIVWRNNSGAVSTRDCATANGGSIAAESSISGTGTGCPQGGTNQTGGPFDPVVTGFGSFGGPTPTWLLATPGLGIDAGNNNFLSETFLGLDLNGDGDTTDTITRDQRGVQRPQNGATDIGAFESGLTTFVTAPDLVVRKSHVGASIQAPPASWTWILEIENVGDGAASFLTTQRVFTDPQPTVSTFTVSTQSKPGLTGSISPGTIGDSTFAQAGPSGATLAPGGRIVIAIPVTQSTTGTFTNPTSASATVVDPDNVVAESNETNNNANQDTVTVALPDLTVSKSNDVSSVVLLGQSFTWRSLVSNGGGFAATFSNGQVIYRDNLPTSGLTYSAPTAVPVSGVTGNATCSVASNILECTASGSVTIAASGSIRFDVTTTPDAGTAGTTFTNPSTTATVDPDGVVTESDETNNNAAANSVFVIAPDLRVFKSNSVSGATTLGNNWTWTAQILNQGVGQATFTNGQVIFSDALPSTTITYGSPTIGVTSSVSGTITCGVSAALLTCTANGPVVLGLAAFFQVNIVATPSAIGTYTNPTNGSATVDPDNVVLEVNDGNNNALANSVVVTAPDLTVTKTNDVGGQTTFPTGWTWRATLANGGNATATFSTGQVMYSDPLPSTGVSYGAAAVGNPVGLSGTVTCGITAATLSCTAASTVTLNAGGSFTVDVAATPTAAGTFTNPTAGPATADPNNVVTESNEANNAAVANTVVVLGSSDLSVTKDDGVTRVEAGGTTTYQIVVSNAGPNDVSNATVSDPVPPACTSLTWTCSATSGSCGAASGTGAIATTVALQKNGSATFLVTCAVSANATGTLENVVTVAVPQGTVDLNGQNNQATDKDAIVHPALSLSKTTTATSFTGPGDVLAYTLVATNSGDVTLSQVQISDPLLPTLTCTPGQPATLAPNATLTCTGSYTVTGADMLAGSVINTATVTGTWDDAAANGNLLFAAPEALVPVVAQATVVVPGIAPAMTAPRLAFQTCTVELQQDWTPRYTKLQFEVWNEDEVKFTGAFECADTWHETDFGAPIDAASQNFTIGVLGTYGARYRVQAVTSTQCPGAQASGILAVQSVLAGPNAKAIGATLAGAGKFTGTIRWDPAGAVPEGGIRP